MLLDVRCQVSIIRCQVYCVKCPSTISKHLISKSLPSARAESVDCNISNICVKTSKKNKQPPKYLTYPDFFNQWLVGRSRGNLDLALEVDARGNSGSGYISLFIPNQVIIQTLSNSTTKQIVLASPLLPSQLGLYIPVLPSTQSNIYRSV